MHVFTAGLAAARRRPGSGLPSLVISGLLRGTGGLTGSLPSREAGLSAVAAYRLAAIGAAVIITVRANRGADRVGGDDGGDAQPGRPGQRLPQDHQADERGQDRVDAFLL